MMTSIFSSFDMNLMEQESPTFNMMFGLIPLVMYNQMYWMTISTRWTFMFQMNIISLNLVKPTKGWHMKGFISMLSSVFLIISITNLWGASPYILPFSSHLLFSLSFGLMMWSTMMSFSVINKMKSASSHFLPENTPLPMGPFLSLVETLSSYIRPITLSFRLAANISAGHVILAMMASSIPMACSSNPSLTMMMISIFISTFYLSFEFMICLVQSFVFSLLSAMYTSDYISVK